MTEHIIDVEHIYRSIRFILKKDFHEDQFRDVEHLRESNIEASVDYTGISLLCTFYKLYSLLTS